MKIKLFKDFIPFLILSICFINCTSDKLENAAFLEVISKNINNTNEIALEYNLKFKPNYFDQNHKIIFYGVSVETIKNEKNELNSKVNDMKIFNPLEVSADCIDVSDVDDFRNQKFNISYEDKGETLEFFINGKKHELGTSKANYNQKSYPSNSCQIELYKPIILLALNEAIGGKNGIESYNSNVEIGCVVYNCEDKIDWKKFFKSQEFIQHTKFNLNVWNSQESIHDEEFLFVQHYIYD